MIYTRHDPSLDKSGVLNCPHCLSHGRALDRYPDSVVWKQPVQGSPMVSIIEEPSEVVEKVCKIQDGIAHRPGLNI